MLISNRYYLFFFVFYFGKVEYKNIAQIRSFLFSL